MYEVSEAYVWFLPNAVGPDFLFIDDNAMSHKSHVVGIFNEENIRRIKWISRSSDLSPVEHV